MGRSPRSRLLAPLTVRGNNRFRTCASLAVENTWDLLSLDVTLVPVHYTISVSTKLYGMRGRTYSHETFPARL